MVLVDTSVDFCWCIVFVFPVNKMLRRKHDKQEGKKKKRLKEKVESDFTLDSGEHSVGYEESERYEILSFVTWPMWSTGKHHWHRTSSINFECSALPLTGVSAK